MESERKTTDEWGDHRPLPSVDLALLPHERRAIRIRNTVGAASVLMIIAAAAAVIIIRSDLVKLEQGSAIEMAAAAVATETNQADRTGAEPRQQAGSLHQGGGIERLDEAFAPRAESLKEEARARTADPERSEDKKTNGRRVSTRFGKARGFREALHSAGISRDEASELIDALHRLVDFRRCRPEDEMVFERRADHRLASFEYRVSATEIYRATRGKNDKLDVKRIQVPLEKRRIAIGGVVSRSLGNALQTIGLGRSFAGVFVEVFEGRVNFRKQTRAGDIFRVIVDKEYVKGAFLGLGTVHALEYAGQRSGTVRAFWYEPRKGKSDFFDMQGRALKGGFLRTPLRYDHISSGFNLRRKHPILKRVIPHLGIDYAASAGTTVWAAGDGTVTFAGEKGANGNLIVLRHGSGYETFYAHLARIFRGIRRGATVRQRQPIGSVGSTGLSTGPHLHFALKRNGKFINPAPVLNGPGRPLPASELPRYRRTKRRLMAELGKIALSPAPLPETDVEPEAPQPAQLPLGSEDLDFVDQVNKSEQK